jgi:hypothetical protein
MNEPLSEPASSGAANGEEGWRPPRQFALLLAVFIFAAFWNVLLGLDTFAVRDFGIFSYPAAFFQRQCFWKGELPWWNPLNCCGLPFLAQFNTLSLYPGALIYLLLPLAWALPFFCLLHLFLGGMGMYCLAARWSGSRAGATLAGVAFAFNGLSLNFLMWPSHIATYAWLPWVILLTEKGWREGGRKLVPAALAAAMEVLAGGPETILFTWLILAALALMEWRKAAIPSAVLARRFFAAGFLALGLSAAQWLPFADFALHCSRNTNYASSEWSMPAGGWANFLTPLFQTYRWQGLAMQPDQYWTSSYYAGIGMVLFAAVALWRGRGGRLWLAGGLVGASMVLALGDHGGVYLWLRRAFPVLGFFRFPIKFVIVTSALFPLLAAFAFVRYENWRKPAAGFWRPEMICGGAIVLLTGLILWQARLHQTEADLWRATLENALSRLVLLAALAGAVYFFATRPAQRRWSVWLIPLLCWLDLVTAVPWQNPTLNPSVYQPGLGQLTGHLNPPPEPGDSRLMLSPFSARQMYYHPPSDLKTAYLLDRAVFLGDCNLLDNLPKVDGFFSVYLREPDRILWLLDGSGGERLARLEDFLGVSQTIAPGKVFDWTPRSTYLPTVSAGQEPIFADDQTTFAAIAQGTADFRASVYLPIGAKSEITAKRAPGARIIDRQFEANRAAILVESPAPAMVLISQAYYHNWQGAVDGKPAPIWRANYAFQALQIPAGRHKLTLVYKDNLFQVGMILAVLAGLVCAALWFGPGRCLGNPVDGGR